MGSNLFGRYSSLILRVLAAVMSMLVGYRRFLISKITRRIGVIEYHKGIPGYGTPLRIGWPIHERHQVPVECSGSI